MDYSKAPYNFIPLSNRVLERYKSVDELPRHDEIYADRLTGTIEYTIECDTDLIVSDGKGKFFRDNKGNYAIPGSTIRGMSRNNIITLGFSTVKDDIEDSKFLYRRFAAPGKVEGITNARNLKGEYCDRLDIQLKQKNEGGKRTNYSILNNVKAGYIRCISDEKYIITPAKKRRGNTYYRISDKSLKDKGRSISGKKLLEDRYYKPYIVKDIHFNMDDKSNSIRSISTSEGTFKGVLLNSGKMHNKKAHYIINEKDVNENQIEIPIDDIRAYREYYIKDKKSDDYYGLPEKRGEEKAVFYAEYKGRVYFGFTPTLRLFYDKSVHEGIPEKHMDNTVLDYNKSLFGYTNNDGGYKSRVSFEDGVKISGKTKSLQIGLASPKASCIAHYLDQGKDDYSTYNNDFTIRGIKFYWMKESKAEIIDNKKMNNDQEAICKGGAFKGKIKFQNLDKDELGLILYSLILEKNCYQQIGMGKPYGFGRIKIKDVEVLVEDMNARYDSLFNDSKRRFDIEELISHYKKYSANLIGMKDINKDPGIATLIATKSFVALNDKDVSYLPLNKFKEFKPLPKVEKIIGKVIQESSNSINTKQNNYNKKFNNNSNKINSNSSHNGNRGEFNNNPMADILKNFKCEQEDKQ